jgi:hypothetical protein
MRWVGHVACTVKNRVAYRVLVGKPEGKRLIVRPRCKWEDNIKRSVRNLGDMDWIWLRIGTSDRLL